MEEVIYKGRQIKVGYVCVQSPRQLGRMAAVLQSSMSNRKGALLHSYSTFLHMSGRTIVVLPGFVPKGSIPIGQLRGHHSHSFRSFSSFAALRGILPSDAGIYIHCQSLLETQKYCEAGCLGSNHESGFMENLSPQLWPEGLSWRLRIEVMGIKSVHNDIWIVSWLLGFLALHYARLGFLSVSRDRLPYAFVLALGIINHIFTRSLCLAFGSIS
ncbi:hypothetical protein V8C42DRAFT_310491 [Trichoderma barbatum]